MTDILCTHLWGPWIVTNERQDETGFPIKSRYCWRCRTAWKDGQTEPRVVIATFE